MQQVDVLCVGDALIDVFLFLKNPDEHFHEAERGKEFCFSLGAKIPVDDAQFCLGGNASNVSVSLSRLGLHMALVAETGDDTFAQLIKKGLEKENILLDFFKQTPNTPATFSVNLVFMHDRTILSRHLKRAHDISFEEVSAKWIYLTSLGEDWKPMYEKVLQYATQTKTKLAFNPGSKQLKAGRESFIHVLKRADVLFVNKEEAEGIIYGSEDVSDTLKNPDTLLHELQKISPGIVSITDGKKGSYAMDKEGKLYQQDLIPGNFVQNTGVGDAYASGFLASLFYNENNIQQAMLWGSINAASVVEHVGAQTGLLTKEKLNERIVSIKK